MKPVIFLLLILASLGFIQSAIAPVPAQNYTWDEQSKTATIYDNPSHNKWLNITSLEVKSGLTEFREIIAISSNYKYSFTDIDFGLETERHKGNKDVNAYKYYLHTNVSYNVTIPIYSTNSTNKSRQVFNNVTKANDTEWYWDNQSFVSGYKNETRYRDDLSKFTPTNKKIDADQTLIYTLVARKQAETGDSAILVKPVFMGASIKELTWWNTSKSRRIDNYLANGTGVLSVNVSNATGVNNGTNVFCNGLCNPDFSDLEFTMDNNTALNFWNQTNNESIDIQNGWAKIWVNKTINGTAINMYYGDSTTTPKVNKTSFSNGQLTFTSFWNFSTNVLPNEFQVGTGSPSFNNGIMTIATSGWEWVKTGKNYSSGLFLLTRERRSGVSETSSGFGDGTYANLHDDPDHLIVASVGNCVVGVGNTCYDSKTSGASTRSARVIYATFGDWDIMENRRGIGTANFYMNGTNQSFISTNVPTTNLGVEFSSYNQVLDIDFAIVGKIPDTSWSNWGAEQKHTFIPPNPLYNTTSCGNFYCIISWSKDTSAGTNIVDGFNITINVTNASYVTATAAINYSLNISLYPHDRFNVTIQSWNNSGERSLTWTVDNATVPNNPPYFINDSISSTLVTVGSSVTITTNVDVVVGSVAYVKVNITTPLPQTVQYNMVNSGGTLWTYTYSGTALIGTYTVDGYKTADDIGTTNTTLSSLNFTVKNAAAVSGGGGGGGGYNPPASTPTTASVAPGIPITLQDIISNKTQASGIIAKCLTESLLFPNPCSNVGYGLVVEATNWWVFLSAYLGSFIIVILAMATTQIRRDWWQDTLVYGTMSVLMLGVLAILGFNIYWLNYILADPKYAYTSLSILIWSLPIAITFDRYNYKGAKSPRMNSWIARK